MADAAGNTIKDLFLLCYELTSVKKGILGLDPVWILGRFYVVKT